MAMKTIICLSFIVLNNFFANMYVKKNIVPHQPKASPHVTGYNYPLKGDTESSTRSCNWTTRIVDQLFGIFSSYILQKNLSLSLSGGN